MQIILWSAPWVLLGSQGRIDVGNEFAKPTQTPAKTSSTASSGTFSSTDINNSQPSIGSGRKRWRNSNDNDKLREAALAKLAKPSEPEDRFKVQGRAYGFELREICNQNRLQCIYLQNIVNRAIIKAHLEELTSSSDIVNVDYIQ